MYPNVHNGTVCNSQDMEATQVSRDKWMDKYVYIQENIIQPEKSNAICSRMVKCRDCHIK